MNTKKQICVCLVTIALCLLMLSPAGAQFLQQGSKLVGADIVGSAKQGISVSLSADGNTAIVGGYTDKSDTGAAWVYTRSGDIWTQQGSKLVGTGAVGAAIQGWSVSVSADGNTAIVGGCFDNSNAGAAWVYTRDGGVWTQQGSKLVGTGAMGGSRQGSSVSISADGNTAVVGGEYDNGSVGAAWVYTRSGGIWTQQGSKLVGTGAVGSARQGVSVSLSADGNTAIVGGWLDNSNTGAAWVFTRSGGVWTQQGSKLVGTGAVGSASQGISVSLSADGNTAIVGGQYDNANIGAAWVYTRSAGVWTQQGNKLVGTDAVGSALQGRSVSLSADGIIAVVGGSGDNGFAGAAWVFLRSAGSWAQQGNKLVGSGAVGNAQQGISVSISGDGNAAIVGGIADDSYKGAAWVYSQTDTSTIFHGFLHTRLGVASLRNLNDTNLIVSNITTMGFEGDGVKIFLPDTISYIDIGYTIDSSAFLSDSAVIEQEFYANLNGVPHTYLGSCYLRKIGNDVLEYAIDDALMWGTSETLKVYRHDTLIYSQPVLSLDKSRTFMNYHPDEKWWKVVCDFLKAGWKKIEASLDFDMTVLQLKDGDWTTFSCKGSASIILDSEGGGGGEEEGIIGILPSGSSDTLHGDRIEVVSNAMTGLLAQGPVTIDMHLGGISNMTLTDYTSAASNKIVVIPISIAEGWNMLSLPNILPFIRTDEIFPTAESKAFYYNNSYLDADTLYHGKGFWLKFLSAQGITLVGLSLDSLAIPVSAGWNMIGSISVPIPVSSITSDPPGMILSDFFGYNNGYYSMVTLEPGNGYWVKTSSAGTLILSNSISPELLAKNAIRIVPTNELPPPPPDGSISSYPGIPKEYALGQAYPNPFNPVTTIKYELPTDSRVNLTVYDILGRTVAILKEDIEQAGCKSVEWKAGAVASGVYFYKLEAVSILDAGKSFTQVKKILLLK